MSSEEKEMKFEQALTRLEEVVKELEDGRLPLEKSLELFEEGISLTRICEARLDAAEQRITILTMDEKGGITQKQVDSLNSPGGGQNY
ncbi:MAG: exodeoxyribonuclease VII small subunit [Desulfotomaculaceae bacterium]|nr:exodeoxyribonuclease VII small subunit [Desulfotomaculaceae bacterium]